MKRHVQKTGVRKYFGADLVELQSEPLAALDAFFAQYGPCIVQGCEIAPTPAGTFDVAAGLVALEADDPDGARRVMVMPFAGASGVALPLYLTAQAQAVERVYGDGKVKPVAYAYTAQAAGVEPAAGVPRLALTAEGANRFVDAVQDAGHRFISDAERSRWNRVLEQAKEYADSVASTGSEAAVRSAKEYTDARETAILAAADARDAVTLTDAKAYADRIVAALAGSAPETLDTLQELAAALGNDPNFAATVLQLVGEKATMEQVNAALAGKLGFTNYLGDLNDIHTAGLYRLSSGCANTPYGNGLGSLLLCMEWNAEAARQVFYVYNTPDIYTRVKVAGGWREWQKLWHSGNFDPGAYFKIDVKGWRVETNCDNMTEPGTYDVNANEVYFVNSPIGAYGQIVVFRTTTAIAQIAFEYATGNTFVRTKYNVTNFSPWRRIYHDGNLGPATASADGLMSAADKAKLDTIGSGGMKLLGAGVVNGTTGYLTKQKGAPYQGNRNGIGTYRVFHNIGHTNYEVQATAKLTGNIKGGHVSIHSQTTNYFDVWTADDASANDLSFFFQIYEF